MIQHPVIFTLKHPAGSKEETAFMKAVMVLTEIPCVQDFQRFRQTSPKSIFTFGLSMKFDTQTDYEAYNNHPVHLDFIASKWIPEVEDFQEIDYVKYDD